MRCFRVYGSAPCKVESFPFHLAVGKWEDLLSCHLHETYTVFLFVMDFPSIYFMIVTGMEQEEIANHPLRFVCSYAS
jgi:hypothetical protein